MYKLLLYSILPMSIFSQVPLVTTYQQDFGNAHFNSWVNNQTLPGWYSNDTVRNANIHSGNPTNTGGFYSYQCSAENDIKIGSKPSNATGDIFYGVRLKNNSGQTVEYLWISYDWFQLSVAQNGNEVNRVEVSYKIADSVTGLEGTGWIVLPEFGFTAPVNSAECCTHQVSSLECNENGQIAGCLPVVWPSDQELFIRFRDPNDPNSDPHLAIDNFFVGIAQDVNCSFLLNHSVEDFKVVVAERGVKAYWKTFSEVALEGFSLEKTHDGIEFETIAFLKAFGYSTEWREYELFVPKELRQTTYFRLKSTDVSGNNLFSEILMVQPPSVLFYRKDQELIFDFSGFTEQAITLVISTLDGRNLFKKKIEPKQTIFLPTRGTLLLSVPELGWNKFLID